MGTTMHVSAKYETPNRCNTPMIRRSPHVRSAPFEQKSPKQNNVTDRLMPLSMTVMKGTFLFRWLLMLIAAETPYIYKNSQSYR